MPPVLTLHVVQYVEKAPVVDGKLDDPCWQTLPQVTTFYKFLVMEATPTPLKTAFQLGCDDKGVYLAIRMFEKDMSRLKATMTQRDDHNLWQDDCAEVYFDPSATAIGFRKFVVNALATKEDLYRMDPANVDPAWSPDGWQAAVSRDEQSWTIETFLPWGDLGKTARDGDLWRFAICRFSWSTGALASSAVGAQYAHPERFGWLLFLRSQVKDVNALARELQERVPEDWLLPLQDKAIQKVGGKASVTTMPALLGDLRKQAQNQGEECRKAVAGDATAAKSADDLAQQLSGVVVETQDPVVFQQSVAAIGGLGQQIEDLKYSFLLKQLINSAMGSSK
jgi:hypothetical protein